MCFLCDVGLCRKPEHASRRRCPTCGREYCALHGPGPQPVPIYDVRWSLDEPLPEHVLRRGILVPTGEESVRIIQSLFSTARQRRQDQSQNHLYRVLHVLWPYLSSFADLSRIGRTSQDFYRWYVGWLRDLLSQAAELGADTSSVARHYPSLGCLAVTPSPRRYARVELGAGPMLSAIALWNSCTETAFTEFRELRALFMEYGMMMCVNILALHNSASFPNPRRPRVHPAHHFGNRMLLGVDATRLERSGFQTRILEFTNPNIGNQDVSSNLGPLIELAHTTVLKKQHHVCVHSGEQYFVLDLRKLPVGWKTTLDKRNKNSRAIFGFFKQTAFAIAACRNVHLMLRFFSNAMVALTEGGEVHLVVSAQYVGRWQLKELATLCGWELVGEGSHTLGFTHMQTQEVLNVHRETGDHIKLRFRYSCSLVQSRAFSSTYPKILEELGNHLITQVSSEAAEGMPCTTLGFTWSALDPEMEESSALVTEIEALDGAIQRRRWRRVPVQGGGDCLYASALVHFSLAELGILIGSHLSELAALRDALATFVRDNWERLADLGVFVGDLVRDPVVLGIRTPGNDTHGLHDQMPRVIQLFLLSRGVNWNIRIYRWFGGGLAHQDLGNPGDPTVPIAHLGSAVLGHFDPMIPTLER